MSRWGRRQKQRVESYASYLERVAWCLSFFLRFLLLLVVAVFHFKKRKKEEEEEERPWGWLLSIARNSPVGQLPGSTSG